MNRSGDYHTKSKTYHDLVYTWNLKKMIQMNLFTKQKHTDLEDKLTVTELGNDGKKQNGRLGLRYTHFCI